MKTLRQSYKLNHFLYLALKYLELATTEEEIRKNDLTKEFKQELEKHIIKNELININVNGFGATGKSAAAMAIGKLIHDLLRKHKQTEEKEFGIKHIARDQRETRKYYRTIGKHHTVLVTDEFDELEEGGENVTAVKQALSSFSDINTQLYIHRVSCSVRDVFDKNANILIETQQINTKNKTTYCLLYYRIFKGGIEYRQLIGHININVKHIINKEWYKQYRKRKFLKMDLINKHGIFRPKYLDYAAIIQKTINELKPITKVQKISKEIIYSYIVKNFQKEKEEYALWGIEYPIKESYAILSLWSEYHRTRHKLNILRSRENKTEAIIIKIRDLQIVTDELAKTLGTLEEELDKKVKLKKEYDRIE